MKWLVFSIFISTLFSVKVNAQRYLTEVFSDYTHTGNVVYATNLSVLMGSPNPEDLFMDIYEPTGDTETARPVILLANDGEYLPEPLNNLPYGHKRDSATVSLAGTLAKRGFVVITYDTRLGWVPNASTMDERLNSYVKAYYRSIQDGFSLVRYLKMDADIQGNTYNIDPTKIVSGGMGSGGALSLAMAFLDKQAELELIKFFDFGSNNWIIDTTLLGDIYGTQTTPLNLANNPTYSNEIQMAFNLGGYVGDSSWIEAGDIPVVSMSCPSDPFVPFEFGAFLSLVTNDFMYNVSGAKGVQQRQAVLGNNLPFSSVVNLDPYTVQADLMNGGLDGLYPFHRPTPENSPWHYWDIPTWNIPHPMGGTYNSHTMLTNPDMWSVKSDTYFDTIVNYLSPRIVCVLNLPGCANASIQENYIENSFLVYPNPNKGKFEIKSVLGDEIEALTVMDVQGNTVYKDGEIESNLIPVDLSGVSSGLYFVSLATKNGSVLKRIIIE